MIYGLFDLNILIKEKYAETKEYLKKYCIEYTENPDIVIEISDSEIAAERLSDKKNSDAYLELICIFRHIAEEMLDFDGLFVHSAVIDVNGTGYLLTGKSGSGKSTLAAGWNKYLENAEIINGDKPILRFFPDGIYAYGSPWCGTEGFNINRKVKLFSGGFVVQSAENSARPLNSDEIFKKLLNQTVIPKNSQRKLKYFELMDRLIKEIPFCEIFCDISLNAVKTSFNEMTAIISE